ncbi:hypothetical protein, partial [Streptococcus pseudopneumoniae]|uniref:hypothetical protein n=1 Tax=Streptococcus pseudopneumoniae TaxID=257758 RepID=UPI0019D4FDA1
LRMSEDKTTDIVERLNAVRCEGIEALCQEAAAVIENLREHIAALEGAEPAPCRTPEQLMEAIRFARHG